MVMFALASSRYDRLSQLVCVEVDVDAYEKRMSDRWSSRIDHLSRELACCVNAKET